MCAVGQGQGLGLYRSEWNEREWKENRLLVPFISSPRKAGKSISKGIMESMTLLADTKEKAVGA